jgi:hypothetical protein
MTKKLEELFNIGPVDDDSETELVEPDFDDETDEVIEVDTETEIMEISEAMELATRINTALAEVRGMEEHDGEMDEIAQKALDNFDQLMSLGMNLTDMAAGPVFSSATQMLKVALDARDSKVTRKLKQVDMMIKKANLDHRKDTAKGGEAQQVQPNVYDRNELLKMLGGDNSANSDK